MKSSRKSAQGAWARSIAPATPQLKRDVAIKILPADVTADAERLARFQREAEILASLNHPNIAQVFGIAPKPSGVRGIVMELAEGQTLAQMLTQARCRSSEALGIAQTNRRGPRDRARPRHRPSRS